MPQSLANVLLHVVFSTKDRYPFLTPDIRSELFPYLCGIGRNLNCPVLRVGGVEDHVHLLVSLARTVTISKLVEDLKTGTSKWIKTKGASFSGFAWQSGYGVFSLGPSEKERTIIYIDNQEIHHQRITFQDELRNLLKEAGLEFDERYLWD